MENQQPGPSTAVNSDAIEYPKNEDDLSNGEETHNLLRHIVQGILNEINEPDKALGVDSYLERASRFTGFHPESLKKIHESDTLLYICRETDRKIVNDTITGYFIRNGYYPSCAHLYNVLHEQFPVYTDKQTFMKMLIKMGYIFKMHLNTTEIMENPVITFEKYLYLKNIDRYRKMGRNIIFIGDASASVEGRIFNLDETKIFRHKKDVVRFMFAVSASGFINLRIVKQFDEENFQNWIENEIVPLAVDSSVIVLDNSEHHNETLCHSLESFEKSLKVEIKEWLQYHQVPYSDDMSKVQLWDLVEKYTDNGDNIFKVDKILRQRGHSVLRLPDCINDLSLATGVRHLISASTYGQEKCTASVVNILKTIGRNTLKKELKSYNSKLIDEEQHLLELEDLKDGIDLNSFKNREQRDTDMELPCFSDLDSD